MVYLDQKKTEGTLQERHSIAIFQPYNWGAVSLNKYPSSHNHGSVKNGSPPIVATWNLSNTAIFHVHDYGRKCILPYITHLRLVGHVHILWRWIFIPIAIIWGWQWKSSPMKTRGQGGPEKDQLMVWLGGLDSWDPLFMKGIATDRCIFRIPNHRAPNQRLDHYIVERRHDKNNKNHQFARLFDH